MPDQGYEMGVRPPAAFSDDREFTSSTRLGVQPVSRDRTLAQLGKSADHAVFLASRLGEVVGRCFPSSATTAKSADTDAVGDTYLEQIQRLRTALAEIDSYVREIENFA